jgi:hypothetical protein
MMMMIMMMMMMNPRKKMKDLLTAPTQILPSKTRRGIVAATERQTFHLSQCAWDILDECKKVTYQTLSHMQTVVFVGRMFWCSIILTGKHMRHYPYYSTEIECPMRLSYMEPRPKLREISEGKCVMQVAI